MLESAQRRCDLTMWGTTAVLYAFEMLQQTIQCIIVSDGELYKLPILWKHCFKLHMIQVSSHNYSSLWVKVHLPADQTVQLL